MITSTSNEQVKYIKQLKEKAKLRKEKGLFTVEGIRMFTEIPKELLVSVFASETFLENNKELLSKYECQIVSNQVFKKISDTVTPQGILAVVKQPKYTTEDILNNRNKNSSCIMVLDRLQDPGNLGTIIRTGEGAGITGVIMSNDCADIFNPKVIRSTMGSIFRVPFVISEDLPLEIEHLKEKGVTIYAADLNGELYSTGNLKKDLAFLIGNEGNGLSDQVLKTADEFIKIPMSGKVESLNASIAAAILMYEAKKF